MVHLYGHTPIGGIFSDMSVCIYFGVMPSLCISSSLPMLLLQYICLLPSQYLSLYLALVSMCLFNNLFTYRFVFWSVGLAADLGRCVAIFPSVDVYLFLSTPVLSSHPSVYMSRSCHPSTFRLVCRSRCPSVPLRLAGPSIHPIHPPIYYPSICRPIRPYTHLDVHHQSISRVPAWTLCQTRLFRCSHFVASASTPHPALVRAPALQRHGRRGGGLAPETRNVHPDHRDGRRETLLHRLHRRGHCEVHERGRVQGPLCERQPLCVCVCLGVRLASCPKSERRMASPRALAKGMSRGSCLGGTA